MSTDLGLDISCGSDLDPVLRTVTGNLCVQQAIQRRLSTPRGSVLGAPNYGLALPLFLSAGITDRKLGELRQRVLAELRAEKRISDVSVTASFSGKVLTVTIRALGPEGPFEQVLSVDKVTVRTLEAA